MNYTLAQINIEGDKHVRNVKDFIKKVAPDIICMQEIHKDTSEDIAKEFNFQVIFSTMYKYEMNKQTRETGIAIFTKLPIETTDNYMYGDNNDTEAPTITPTSREKNGSRPKNRFNYHYSVLSIKIILANNKQITVANTHFPVTDHSIDNQHDHVIREHEVSEMIRTQEYFERMKEYLKTLEKPLIFTGDLNNTRGEFMFDGLAHILNDQIPKQLRSSLDPMHRKGELPLVVDAIFTSTEIQKINTFVYTGISDHKAFCLSFIL